MKLARLLYTTSILFCMEVSADNTATLESQLKQGLNPQEEVKTRTLLGINYIDTKGKDNDQSLMHFEQAICIGWPKSIDQNVTGSCRSSHKIQTLTQDDYDHLASAMAGIGLYYFNQKELELSFRAYTLANQMLASTNTLSQTQQNTASLPDINNIGSGSKKTDLMQALQFGQQYQQGRESSRNKKSFYGMVQNKLCSKYSEGSPAPDINTSDADQTKQQSADIMGQHFARMMEAKRGNNISDDGITELSVLNALNQYLASTEVIQQYGKHPDRRRNKFIASLSQCGYKNELIQEIGMGAISTIGRNSRDLNYYVTLIDVVLRAQELNETENGSAMPSIPLSIYLALVHKLKIDGEDQKVEAYLNKAIDYMDKSIPNKRWPHMLAWTNTLSEMGKQFHNKNKNTKALQSTLNSIIEKHQTLSKELNTLAQLNNEDAMIQEAMFMMEKNGVKEMLSPKGMESMIQDKMKEMGLPPEMMAKMQSQIQAKMAENKDQFQNIFSPEKMKEQLKNNPAFANMDQYQDIHGTQIERIRELANRQRLFQLGIANYFIAIQDSDSAKSWLDKKAEQAQVKGILSASTTAYEAYIKAKYFHLIGESSNALKQFDTAIAYWYTRPLSAMETMASPFPTQTYLLELAAKRAISVNAFPKALQYIEMARHANLGNSRLYGYLNSKQLSELQAGLMQEYKTLIRQAEKTAKNKGDADAFRSAKNLSDKQFKNSFRNVTSPLMPSLTGLDPLLPWLDSSEVQHYVGKVEIFNSLWGNRALEKTRQTVIVNAQNRSIEKQSKDDESQAILATSAGADDDLLRSAPLIDGIAFVNSNKNEQYAKNGLSTIKEIMENVGQDTSILSYWVSPETTFSFVTNSEEIQGATFNTRNLHFLRNGYTSNTQAEIYQTLIAPYTKQLKEKVVLVVNGPLQNLPFSALSANGKNYLSDTHLLRYSPSIHDIFLGNTQSKKNKKMLVLAPTQVAGVAPLPGAKREAERINSIFTSNDSDILLDNEVTRTAIKKTISDYKIVHFAGHAKLNDDLPDFSSLKIAAEQSKDNSFYVNDIRSLDLTGLDLAVLSACESGRTNNFNLNNEFSTISSAFMDAGTNAVVASLHPVDDAVTETFMAHFYEALLQGQTKDRALQIAQKAVRNDFSKATHWAAFVLIGNPAPIAL